MTITQEQHSAGECCTMMLPWENVIEGGGDRKVKECNCDHVCCQRDLLPVLMQQQARYSSHDMTGGQERFMDSKQRTEWISVLGTDCNTYSPVET